MKGSRKELLAWSLCGFLALTLITCAWRQKMSWNAFNGNVTGGVKVGGDPKSPPTHWWNWFYLAKFGWKTVAVFKLKNPEDAARGYRIGYKPTTGDATGETRVKSEVQTSFGFRMKVGYEECTFFAVDRNDAEVPIEFVAKTVKGDAQYADLPLH